MSFCQEKAARFLKKPCQFSVSFYIKSMNYELYHNEMKTNLWTQFKTQKIFRVLLIAFPFPTWKYIKGRQFNNIWPVDGLTLGPSRLLHGLVAQAFCLLLSLKNMSRTHTGVFSAMPKYCLWPCSITNHLLQSST